MSEVKPAAGLMLPFQQRMRLMLLLIFAAFKITSQSHKRGCSCMMGDENLGHWVDLFPLFCR